MRALTIPPLKRPPIHPARRPIVLPPRLDPSISLCLLPMRAGKWVDYSGNGYHGTLATPVWTAKGRKGPALYFDGNDYVSCGDVLRPSSSVSRTIEQWAYLTDVTNVCLWSTGNLYWTKLGYTAFIIISDTQLQLAYCHEDAPSYVTLTIALSANKWTHFVTVIDVSAWPTATASIYIDGGLQVSDTYTMSNPTGGHYNAFMIGAGIEGYPGEPVKYHMTGIMDEMALYQRALTASEILALYEQGRP